MSTSDETTELVSVEAIHEILTEMIDAAIENNEHNTALFDNLTGFAEFLKFKIEKQEKTWH